MENNDYEKKIRHLEMIEGIITRMGNNSFQLKGWAVTLVSAISVLSEKGADKRFIFLVFIPLLSFWMLDAYYLQTERKYKLLYDYIRRKSADKIDYNLSTDIVRISYKKERYVSYFFCLFSKIEIMFYGIISLVMAILIYILFK